MYEKIVKLNPDIKIYRTTDKEFIPFGKKLDFINSGAFINAAKDIKMPETGSAYYAEIDEFKDLPEVQKIKALCFGELPIEAGYCYGSSNKLNAAEWHKSSEINVAVTSMVLILGQVQDIVDNQIDSSKFKAFYIEKGEAIEVYSTTLHFCPCQTEESGFGSVVILPAGTNLLLDKQYDDKLLYKKNKWLLAHKECESLVAKGLIAGLTGINYEIKF